MVRVTHAAQRAVAQLPRAAFAVSVLFSTRFAPPPARGGGGGGGGGGKGKGKGKGTGTGRGDDAVTAAIKTEAGGEITFSGGGGSGGWMYLPADLAGARAAIARLQLDVLVYADLGEVVCCSAVAGSLVDADLGEYY